ncbi:hypothetical protein [Luteolibacter sp. LG18]|uniref:hypothetical protein n=1 Tax=Luteolibacter sp. LG18 TaxID=2819286 RepID=UPI0030C76CB2
MKALALFALLPLAASAEKPFVLRVIDAETKRPVPLIRVTTTHQLSEFTDNAGMATFDDPDLLGREVWFGLSGHGYELKADGFGNRGVRLTPRPGESATVEIRRLLAAERIQRLTGGGLLYHQQRFTGASVPPPAGLVFGCDTVDTAEHGGKRYWLWGDTSRPGYPLGNFDTTLATTAPVAKPDEPVRYDYFTQPDGFVKRAAPIAGTGPTWLGALVSLKDQAGKAHLVASYAKIKPPMDTYERGLCEFDEAEQVFKKVLALPLDSKRFPDGHAFRHDGRVFFGQATPALSIPDNYEAWRTPASYTAVACDTAFTDATTGKPVKAHNGSVAWNPWRKKWTSVFTESNGTSALGEIRYAEADTPQGPWRKCVKIVTHDRYTFYNPLQHPELAEDGGRVIWFEGTYTATFSGNPDPTPRHDYNQVLYRLDLADPRMKAAME